MSLRIWIKNKIWFAHKEYIYTLRIYIKKTLLHKFLEYGLFSIFTWIIGETLLGDFSTDTFNPHESWQ